MKKTSLREFLSVISFALIALLVSLPAAACIPRRSADVYFEKNSALISRAQMQKLSAWTAEMNATFPNQELLRLGAIVENDETDPEQLGRQRELAVRLALIELKFFPDVVRGGDKVWISRFRSRSDPLYDDVKRVELEFTPGCPRGCGGCPNMTPVVKQCGDSSFIALNFQQNSAKLLRLQLLKLKNWATTIRADHPDTGLIEFEVGADKAEEGPERLIAERGAVVRQALVEAGFNPGVIKPDPGSTVIGTGPGRNMRMVATRAELTFTLECTE